MAATTGPRTTRRFVAHTMGMPISLALRGRHADDRFGVAAWTDAMAVLLEVDRVFSTYRSDSYVSRLGRGEIGVAGCPDEVAEVLALGAIAQERSHGAFAVVLPGPDGAPVLDPSGVVKGWAVERAAEHLRRLHDTDFCLSAGGDMVCRTLDVAAEPWRIGIEDPHDLTRVLAVVPVRTGAVATSGSARRGEHVVDARTGRPPTDVASVTVVGDDLTWVDMDATAAYAMGPDAARWLDVERHRTAVVVWRDGSVTRIAGPLGRSAVRGLGRPPGP